jgi:hypothetical protein
MAKKARVSQKISGMPHFCKQNIVLPGQLSPLPCALSGTFRRTAEKFHASKWIPVLEIIGD